MVTWLVKDSASSCFSVDSGDNYFNFNEFQ